MLKKRAEIEERFKWKITDLYETDAAWEADFAEVDCALHSFGRFSGALGDARKLSECLALRDAVFHKAERLAVYAAMKLHEDGSDSRYQGLSGRGETLLAKLAAAAAFIEPEILAIDSGDENAIEDMIGKNPALATYRHFLDDLARKRAHVLSPELEQLIASSAEVLGAAENIYAMLNDTDLKFGPITDKNGVETELTHANYASFMEDEDRAVRESAYNSLYKAYGSLINTIAAAFDANAKSDVFQSRARRYGSALECALSDGNISTSVYMNLLSAVHEFLPQLHRYIKLRKRLMGVDELRPYDLYANIIESVDTKVLYSDACEEVLRSLVPLGDDYVSAVRSAFGNGWIDVYENECKRSGAYAWGVSGCHPFVLLNYENRISDMFTVAHEMGHAMHSDYTWGVQPYIYSDHTIFTAEVASTVNESLLMRHMLNTARDPQMRKYLVYFFLEQFRGTVFRQAMFAEFELMTHQLVEDGETLTVRTLNGLYRGLFEKYMGDAVAADGLIELEWARIPHFYNAFYVYQYATGFSAAIALSNRILEQGRPAVLKYIEFLKSGTSDYSLNLLRNAGVDMESPEPVRSALEMFSGLLDELEAICGAK